MEATRGAGGPGIFHPHRRDCPATFGVTPDAHSRLKGLDKVKTGNNLRDHMTDLKLIFTMLGEAGTTEIAQRKDAQGFAGNRTAAKEGGAIAGNARKALEAKSGKLIVSKENFLPPSRKKLGKKIP